MPGDAPQEPTPEIEVDWRNAPIDLSRRIALQRVLFGDRDPDDDEPGHLPS